MTATHTSTNVSGEGMAKYAHTHTITRIIVVIREANNVRTVSLPLVAIANYESFAKWQITSAIAASYSGCNFHIHTTKPHQSWKV